MIIEICAIFFQKCFLANFGESFNFFKNVICELQGLVAICYFLAALIVSFREERIFLFPALTFVLIIPSIVRFFVVDAGVASLGHLHVNDWGAVFCILACTEGAIFVKI